MAIPPTTHRPKNCARKQRYLKTVIWQTEIYLLSISNRFFLIDLTHFFYYSQMDSTALFWELYKARAHFSCSQRRGKRPQRRGPSTGGTRAGVYESDLRYVCVFSASLVFSDGTLRGESHGITCDETGWDGICNFDPSFGNVFDATFVFGYIVTPVNVLETRGRYGVLSCRPGIQKTVYFQTFSCVLRITWN